MGPLVTEKQTFTKEMAIWIYEKMQQIRQFEDKLHELFGKGVIPGFVHLYAGEEAIAVGVCALLGQSDMITSTHRGHGHCIAKGCDLNGMMAEIYGKKTGLCKGKGGSMHIADVEKGMLGANGVVGGGFPLAVGAGLTAKLKRTKEVSVCFFGEGANNQGTFHESINLAAIWNLPVIFVAENNGFAESTPFQYASSCSNIADRAASYNIPSEIVDGKDVVAVFEAAKRAIDRAREGKGPTLIECKTYRNYGHFEGDAQTYKSKEVQALQTGNLDALKKFREYAVENGLMTLEEANSIEQQVQTAIEKAVEFAENSDYPKAEELLDDVYVSYK